VRIVEIDHLPRRWMPACRGLSLALAVVAGLLSQGAVLATAATGPVEAFRRGEFRIVAKQEELPPEIRTALVTYLKSETLADPGRKWNATDVAADPSLPRRRLTLAGFGNTVAFVAYEHGGPGKHAHLLLLALEQGKASVAHACVGPSIVPMNLDGLRGAVRKKTCAPVAVTEQEEETPDKKD
jgi:hypothetical protein